MSEIDDFIEKLEAKQDALVAPYNQAKAEGNQAAMDRLSEINYELSILIDDATLLPLHTLAVRLAELEDKIREHQASVDAIANNPLDFSLDGLETRLADILSLSSEADENAAQPLAVNSESETIDISSSVNSIDPGPQATGTLMLSEPHLIALWKRSAFPIDGKGIIVFGIRGCRPVDYSGTGFDTAHEIVPRELNYTTMNCTLGQWRPGHGLAVFPGSTVPYRSLVQNAISREGEGVNQLGCGRYKSYQAGWHKRSEEENGHWALQQASPVNLQRTQDDADYDRDDAWHVGKYVGDNIHCAFNMGADGRIPDVSFSSAGCQTIAGTVKKGVRNSERGPWRAFIAPFKTTPGSQRFTEYVLFHANEVQQMIRNQYRGKTIILRMGSYGPMVKALQRALATKLNTPLAIDGDFGPATFQAVITFQATAFGPSYDDGIVGAETAGALGFSLPLFDFANAVAGGPGYLQEETDSIDTGSDAGAPPADDAIAWGARVRDLHGEAFKTKVLSIANRLQCDPNHLMAVMAFETGRSFRTDQMNAAGSGATGLIQFMPKTAEWLGTSTNALKQMTGVEQLDYVEKYFRKLANGRPLKTLSDVYMTVLYPRAVGRPESYVLFQKPSIAYTQNRGLDRNQDGLITKYEATRKVQRQLKTGLKASNMA